MKLMMTMLMVLNVISIKRKSEGGTVTHIMRNNVNASKESIKVKKSVSNMES